MPKLVSEKVVKRLTKRDGSTEYVDTLNIVEIKYSKPFVKVPKVFVNIDGDANFKVTNKTTDGFKVRFKDGGFSNTAYTGEIEWEAVPSEAFE